MSITGGENTEMNRNGEEDIRNLLLRIEKKVDALYEHLLEPRKLSSQRIYQLKERARKKALEIRKNMG